MALTGGKRTQGKSAPKASRPKAAKKAQPKTQKQQKPEQAPDTVAGNGTIILSKAALAGRIGAWALVAFLVVGAIFGYKQVIAPPEQIAPIVDTGLTAEDQQAGDFARGFVASWLRATRDDAEALAHYRKISQGEITQKTPVEFRDLSLASLDVDDHGVATAVVAAEVKVPPMEAPESEGDDKPEDNEEAKDVWAPSWYQVNVIEADGQFTALQWPAPIPAPEAGSEARVSYTYPASEDIDSTVASFFNAYILGDGEVDRLTSPESKIRPLGPNPYRALKITKTVTDEDFRDELPEDGTEAKAVVSVQMGDSDAEGRTASYALTLETRGGRWEVKTLDPAPKVSELSEATENQSESPSDPAAAESEQPKE